MGRKETGRRGEGLRDGGKRLREGVRGLREGVRGRIRDVWEIQSLYPRI